jgi:hypothetical protein
MSMTDPVGWLVAGMTRLGIGLGILVGDGLNALFRGAARGINGSTATSRKLTKAQRSEEAENQRLAGCKQVVLEFAEVLGFIARECISRDELEQLIDEGIEPEGAFGHSNVSRNRC